MEINNENYFSEEAEKEYMTYSQIKDFLECEAQALAKIEGRWETPESDALLQGGYLDAFFSHELEEFKQKHPQIFKKDGSLLAKFDVCRDAIKTIEEDEGFKNMFFRGDPQVTLTGAIEGIPFKGKIDMLYPDRIVNMKCMASVDPVWDEKEHRKKPFYSYYRYDLQAAIYQELVYQKTGIRLPYYLAVATKEKTPKKFVFYFKQEVLDKALEEVKAKAPRFQAIKKGEVDPIECGECDYYYQIHKFEADFDIMDITLDNM